MGVYMFLFRKFLRELVFVLGLFNLNLQACDLSSKDIENLVRYSRSPMGISSGNGFGFPFHYTAFGDWTNHGYPRPDSGLYGEYFDIGW